VPEPGSSGGFNRYRYTRNNPLRYTDPSGHSGCDGAVSAFDQKSLCLSGPGPIDTGFRGGRSGLAEVVVVLVLALAIDFVQDIALNDVEVPTDSGGYAGELQPPFTEEIPLLDGNQSTTETFPADTPSNSSIFDEFVAPNDFPVDFSSQILGRNNRDFVDVFMNGTAIRRTRQVQPAKDKDLLDDLADEHPYVNRDNWRKVEQHFDYDDYEIDLHWFEGRDDENNIYIERGKIEEVY